MRSVGLLALVGLGFLIAAGQPVRAGETVTELWRSRYGGTGDFPDARNVAAANPTDGTIWLVEGANVTHLAPDGTLLFRSPALYAPYTLAVDPKNGSCWVLEGSFDQLLHFAADGTLLSATPGQGTYGAVVSPSPFDGSAWVAGYDHASHISAAGQEVWRANWRSFPIVVDPNDGSAWVSDGNTGVVARLRSDNTEVWRLTGVGDGSAAGEDLRNQSVWVAADQLMHVSATGAVLWQGGASSGLAIRSIHVAAADGSVLLWFNLPPHVDSPGILKLVRLDSLGNELWSSPGASLVAYNDGDNSFWIFASIAPGSALVQLSLANQELRRISFPDSPLLLAYGRQDNSWWLRDPSAKRIWHVGQDSAVMWQDSLRDWGWYIWLDPRDGSSWTTDGENLVRLASDGTEIERRPLPVPSSLFHGAVISPTDGSWWMMTEAAGTATPILLHLDASGAELWRREGVGWWLAVDESDGSAWTVDSSFWLDPNTSTYRALSHVHHFAPSGAELLTKDFPSLLSSPAVDPSDGSLWLSKNDFVTSTLLHLSSSGDVVAEIPTAGPIQGIAAIAVLPSDGSVYGTAESSTATGSSLGYAFRMASNGVLLWLQGGFAAPSNIALNPSDGTLWISDSGSGSEDFSPGSAVVHLGADGTELWRSGTFNAPATIQVNPRDGSAWVSDYFDGQLVHLQAPFSPFSDVQRGNWAFSEIVACADAGIVTGFPDGTYAPDASVTRDQMAVYISRGLAGGDANIPSGPAAATFSDVPDSYWAYRYVEYAAAEGIVTGYSDGTYKPTLPLDRSQMAVFIARSIANPVGEAGLAGYIPPRLPSFPDVPTYHWAYKYVEFVKAAGVVQGYPDGYHPEEIVNRAQMAVYVARAFKLPF
jgi:hypothetical protein